MKTSTDMVYPLTRLARCVKQTPEPYAFDHVDGHRHLIPPPAWQGE